MARSPQSATDGLSRKAIAAVLGVDERSITNYQDESPAIPLQRHGRRVLYPLAPAVAWYVERERRLVRQNKAPSELDAARSRKAIADARRVELELARLEGSLIPLDELARVVGQLADRVVAAATGGLTSHKTAVVRAETSVQALAVLERIGDSIIDACRGLVAELEAEAERAEDSANAAEDSGGGDRAA